MPITVATQNVWGRSLLWSQRKRALGRALRSADIVVLQEVRTRGRRTQAHDLADQLGLPHARVVSAGRTLFWHEGVGIISRWPIQHAAWERLPQDRRNLLDRIAPRVVFRAVIQTPLGRLEVYALHLSLSRTVRTRTASAITAFVQRKRRDLPADFTLIAGDFNASADEPCMQTIQAQCNVIDLHPNGPATFPAYSPLRRLDYLLISPNLRATRLQRRRSIGSDHCALLAQIDR